MKKKWEEPKIQVQEFVANEYVAACYYLACNVGRGEKDASNGPYWNGTEYGGVDHAALGTSGTCADKTANRVITDEGGLLANSQVGEYNKEQGWITGGIDTWLDTNNNGKVDADDVIYWHTVSKTNDRRWNHKGTLELADKNHPNHS